MELENKTFIVFQLTNKPKQTDEETHIFLAFQSRARSDLFIF